MAAYCLGVTEVSFKQNSVTAEKLVKRVAYRIASLANPDRLHHSRITELTMAQLSVKQLRHRRKESECLTTSHGIFFKVSQMQIWFLYV